MAGWVHLVVYRLAGAVPTAHPAGGQAGAGLPAVFAHPRDDIAGKAADRQAYTIVIELTNRATGIDLSSDLRSDLAAAKSWLTDETGRDIYDRVVQERRI